MALKVKNERLFSVDPRNGATIGEVERSRPEEIRAILVMAEVAFKKWSAYTLASRLEFGREAYRAFYRKKDDIAQLISGETGKPLVEAYASEILPILDCFKYHLKHLPRILKQSKIRSANPLLKLRKGQVTYQPIGAVAVISPWNFPFLLAMQHIIPALLAGNAVIHKPSEHTSLTGLKIGEIFDHVQMPEGVLQVVTGLADVGQALAEAKLDKIFFTGSTAVGKKIYQSAAQNLVPVNMELGGSDPMIVLEDANLERAVNGALWGAFSNAGQACLSVERLYVQETVFKTFMDRLTAKAERLSLGPNPTDRADISSLANDTQFLKVSGLVEDAVENGAVVRFGGKSRQESGDLFFEPTILTDTNSSMRLVKEEVFGPIVTVQPFRTDDEALTLANNSDYGLAASIWTENSERGKRMAERIEAASVMINDVQAHIAQPEAPYSGYKKSGIGVSHGPWGVLEMVKPKYVSVDRPLAKTLVKLISRDFVNNNLWWFKYHKSHISYFKAFADFLHGDKVGKKLKAIPAALRALSRGDYL